MIEIEKKLEQKLAFRKEQNNLRTLKLPGELIDFTSNDYLSLSRSKELIQKINSSLLADNFLGATGSRLLSGNSELFENTEKFLSKLFKAEKVLIFNSGYNANIGLLSSVTGKGDTILYDELIHSSLKDGARLSLANHLSFQHNNIDHLEKKIKISKGSVFVVAESIYSMDGDTCPLGDLIASCHKYGAALILDEAHSTGISGLNGNGLACALGVEDKIFARIYTFGKAMGVHGACIAGSSILINYLINFSRPFIYTTALPPHSVLSIKHAFEYLSQNQGFQETLKGKIALFKSLIAEAEIPGLIESNSPIQALLVQNSTDKKQISETEELTSKNSSTFTISNQKNLIKKLADTLQKKGFDVRPILSPTVKEGAERIRICLHNHNADLEIHNLVKAIKDGLNEVKLI